MIEKNLNIENYLSADSTTGAAANAINLRAPRTPKSLCELSPKELKELIDFMSSKYFKEVQEIKDFLYNIVDKETTRRNNAFPYFLDLNNQERYFRLKVESAVPNYAHYVYFFEVKNIELIEENKTCWFGSVGAGSYNKPIYELYGLEAYAAVSGFVIKNRKTIEEFSTFPDKDFQIEDNTLFGYNNNDEFFMTTVEWKSASLEPDEFIYDDSIFKAERISKDEFDIISKNFKI